MTNPNMILVHTRTKAAFSAKAQEFIRAGKAKTSYPRIVEKGGLSAAKLHAMLSPVTELPGGYTKFDARDVAKLDKAVGAKGELLRMVAKGAKQPEDPKAKAEIPEKTFAIAVEVTITETEKPAKKAAAPRKRAAKKSTSKDLA